MAALVGLNNSRSFVATLAIGLVKTLVLRREYSKSPYYQIIGTAAEEEYASCGRQLDAHARAILLARKAFVYMRAVKAPEPGVITGTSTNTVHWNSLAATPIQLDLNGTLRVANRDKEVLIKHLFLMMKKGEFAVKLKVAVISEGADNGDYLGLVVPALLKTGAESINVSLHNGNTSKLTIAREFASLLVGKANVSTHVVDSFKEFPSVIDRLQDHQHLHLPFRLVIVEEPEKVSYFLRDRMDRMREGDFMVASFLHWDAKAEGYFSSFDFSPERFPNHVVFKKPATRRIYRALSRAGFEESNPKMANTAYSLEGISALVDEVKGKILQMCTIPAATDEGNPITIVGVILTK